LVECLSFDALIAHLLAGTADQGVMAIENSIAGSIIPNYNLVYHNNLHIIGEHYQSIHHNLMVKKGQTLAEYTNHQKQCNPFHHLKNAE